MQRRVLCLAVGAMLAVWSAGAADIALFNNTSYVDWSPGDDGSEASNLYDTLVAQGNTVSTFTGISAAAFSAAVAGKQVLAIPELENGDLNPDLDAAARSAIAAFVNAGGVLLMFCPNNGDPLAVLNSTFGYSLTSPGSSPTPITLNSGMAAGTPFEGGPATIPQNDATDSVTEGSLPGAARMIYEDDDGDSVVTMIPYGSGYIVMFGWDWYDAAPTGTQDGGWLTVLAEAVALAGQGVIGIPTLSGLGLIALVLLIAAAGAVLVIRR